MAQLAIDSAGLDIVSFQDKGIKMPEEYREHPMTSHNLICNLGQLIQESMWVIKDNNICKQCTHSWQSRTIITFLEDLIQLLCFPLVMPTKSASWILNSNSCTHPTHTLFYCPLYNGVPPWSSGSVLDHKSLPLCSNIGVGIAEGCFISDFASLPLKVTRPI